MAYLAQHDTELDDDEYTEESSVRPAAGRELVVSPRDWIPAPTSPNGPQRPAYGPGIPQHAYLGSVLPPHVLADLLGQDQDPPMPAALVRTQNFFTHIGNSHLTPGLGVLTLAGISSLAHTEPYHPLIGGAIIAAGAWLIRTGVDTHRRHGADADVAFTRGAAGVGAATASAGVAVTAGLTWWTALATAAGLWGAYGAAAAWRHHRSTAALRERREFVVGLVAAGNTGPALTGGPAPTGLPYAEQISDEEYRIRKAFGKLRAPEIILSPVRRQSEDVWSVHIDLIDTNFTAEQVAKWGDRLATSTGARRVEVIAGKRPGSVKLIVHDGEDPLENAVPWPGAVATSILDPITIGMFEDNTPVTIVLAWAHTLVAGATDNGKSGVVNAILCSTLGCRDLVRILVDCKAGAPEMRAYRDVAFHLATTPEEGMRTLAGLLAVYEYRGNLLAEKDVPYETDEDGETVRKWRPEYGPFIMPVIDELSELTGEFPEAAAAIQRLRALQRFIGEFALDATQMPSRAVFGGTTDARQNYRNRIALGTTEQGAGRLIFGEGSHGRNWRPEELDLPGKMLVFSREHRRARVSRACLITDQDIARAVAQFRGNVPDLDEGSAEAFWEAYHAWQPEAGRGGPGPRGGRAADEIEDAVPFGKPHLVVVQRYPDGTPVPEQYAPLWQLLGEYGEQGATAKQLAARAEMLGHQFTSQGWVRQRLEFFRANNYVSWEKDGREDRHWRSDLTAGQRKDA
jgi:S-DNA-T family DNA segregation ATPase FtsK/SpoIIIE